MLNRDHQSELSRETRSCLDLREGDPTPTSTGNSTTQHIRRRVPGPRMDPERWSQADGVNEVTNDATTVDAAE
jgi:hypothetical protein